MKKLTCLICALCSNLTGPGNTSMGILSLLHNTIGSYNTAIGFFSATGSSNSSFGCDTLYHNTTGPNNSAFGYHALLRNNTQGYNNTSLGSTSGQSMLITIGSSCIGANSDTSYNYSTALGYNSVCIQSLQKKILVRCGY